MKKACLLILVVIVLTVKQEGPNGLAKFSLTVCTQLYIVSNCEDVLDGMCFFCDIMLLVDLREVTFCDMYARCIDPDL